MKANYKVGDAVKIREDLKIGYGCRLFVNSYMVRLGGKTVRIARVDNCGSAVSYKLKEDNGDFNWTEDMFEEPKKHQPIIIYQKDANTVVALDKETHKEAKAVCSKDDKFDFMAGAKLAFERLESKSGKDKDLYTAKEKREALLRFCLRTHCLDCCLLDACRCEHGAYFFTKDTNGNYVLTDAEINLAYALVKRSEEK